MESTEVGATTPSNRSGRSGRSGIRRIIRPRFLIGLVVASAGITAVAFAVVFYVDRNGDEKTPGSCFKLRSSSASLLIAFLLTARSSSLSVPRCRSAP
jgi:hypothetical protein